MSDIGEAVGTATEGGLLARAVSSKAGTDGAPVPLERGHFSENACLNCGTTLTGAHCHNCGQKAHLHRTLRAFLHDLLHGALHLDSKIWRTLPKLAVRPGELTRRYIDGERARFVSPMALFLFSIFLMFAVFQLAGISTPTDLGSDRTREAVAQARQQISTMQERQGELESRIGSGELSDEDIRAAQAELKELEDQISAVSAAAAVPVLRELIQDQEGQRAEGVGAVPVVSDGKGETTIPLSADDDAQMKTGTTDVVWLDQALDKWRTNPGLMLYKLQTNFYKFSWLLIPLSIPFVWLLFAWKRQFKAYDHAIFVTYSLAFMSLLILTIVLSGLAGLPLWIISFASILIPPIHLYKQLRRAYGLSRFSAFWRLCILSVFIIVILTLFLQALLFLGAF